MTKATTIVGAGVSPLARPMLARLVGSTVISILCYHEIEQAAVPETVSFDRFRRQLDLLERDYEIVDIRTTLQQIGRGGRGDGRRVALTFDDARSGAISLALPELERRHIPYTVFVIANEARSGDRRRFAALDEIVETARGYGTIGAHSASHRLPLTMMSDIELASEFRGSAELLEECGVTQPRVFCYPWAAYDDRVASACHEFGFDAAFAGQWLRYHSPRRMFALGRVTVDHDDDLGSFAMKLGGSRDVQSLLMEAQRRIATRIGRLVGT